MLSTQVFEKVFYFAPTFIMYLHYLFHVFRSNRNKRFIQYTQYFPEKALDGEYEFEGSLMASNMANGGKWNLTLCKEIYNYTVYIYGIYT